MAQNLFPEPSLAQWECELLGVHRDDLNPDKSCTRCGQTLSDYVGELVEEVTERKGDYILALEILAELACGDQ